MSNKLVRNLESPRQLKEVAHNSFIKDVEGNGRIEIMQDNKKLVYNGEWINGNFKVYHFKSDLLEFVSGHFLFQGVEYPLYSFRPSEVRTHLSFTVNAFNSDDRFLLFAPIVHNAAFYLEIPREPLSKVFYLEVDHGKPESQFLLSPMLNINSITEKLLTSENGILMNITITIRKNVAVIEKEYRDGKDSQHVRCEKNLFDGPLRFFEERCRKTENPTSS
jgi:hypothetical protein